jgi:hypothetical protein
MEFAYDYFNRGHLACMDADTQAQRKGCHRQDRNVPKLQP